jgi:hypothetical protein
MANVEYRQCDRPECGMMGQGARCIHCGWPYTGVTVRLVKPRLIVVDEQKPLFERVERWRCPATVCGQLYEPPLPADILRMTATCECGAAILGMEERAALLDPAPSVLESARRVARILKARKNCTQCHRTLHPPAWCPHCLANRSDCASPLPLRPTWLFTPSSLQFIPLQNHHHGEILEDDAGGHLSEDGFDDEGFDQEPCGNPEEFDA